MNTFSEHVVIDRPRHIVWGTLADVGTIAKWNPGLTGSHRINDLVGVGAARHCDISAKHSLAEEVTEFEPEQRITFRITKTTLPFAEAHIRFRLTDSRGSTVVTASPTYRLKYGPIGRLIAALTVQRAYRTGMRNLLAGLKDHVERHHDG